MPDKLKIISAVSVVFLLFVASQSYARVWYVKQDGTGDAPTIQAAIDSAVANDTVLVEPGTYTQRLIYVDKMYLTVVSENGAEETILHTSEVMIMGIGGARHVTLRGFCFEDASAGLSVAVSNEDILIEDNIFRNITGEAISLEFMCNAVIRGNLIYSNGNGISLHEFSSADIIQNTISHNTPGEGILTDGSSGLCYNPIRHNIISYNAIGVSGFCAEDFECNDIFGNGSNVDPPPFGTNGNIAVDPQFCGVEPQVSGNYFLQSDSPCAPGQHPDGYPCGLIGRLPVGCQDTAVERTTWGAIKAIYR
jgi:parallel beta-helix repeat protein